VEDAGADVVDDRPAVELREDGLRAARVLGDDVLAGGARLAPLLWTGRPPAIVCADAPGEVEAADSDYLEELRRRLGRCR
jgi:hypothetical protein